MPKTWIGKDNFYNASDSESPDSSIIRTQWGRLISCLPQLNSIDMVEANLSLGRSDECDIVIHKSKFLPNQLLFISKVHFVITRDPDDSCIAYITDMSKNGTYINEELIGRNNKIILQNNDSIAIGDKLRVYIYKSLNYLTDQNYLPKVLRRRYELTRLLGKGACGEVRLAYDRFSCEKYAMKKIIKGRNTPSQINNINHPNRIRTEIEILQTLSHPLIVNMKEIIEVEEEAFLVLDYIQGGELSTRISTDNGLTETHAKFFFYQITLAVQYLHSNGITHRDLKPGNILLSSQDTYPLIKVTDFGLSNLGEGYDLMKTICGTWHYIAPEVLNPNIPQYDSQVDIWSMGVILFYMLSKKLPFNSRDKSTLGKLIVTGTYSMDYPCWYEVSSAAKDLIKKMLTVNPKERITVHEILKHRWIDNDCLMKFKLDNLLAKNMEMQKGKH